MQTQHGGETLGQTKCKAEAPFVQHEANLSKVGGAGSMARTGKEESRSFSQGAEYNGPGLMKPSVREISNQPAGK